MRIYPGLVLLSVLVASSCTPLVGAADQKTSAKQLAGWFGVFPWIDYYDAVFEAPIIEKRDSAATYRQKVTYWIGGVGRGKCFAVTVARDPNFKVQYAAETLRKQKDAPEEVCLQDKFTTWVWKAEKKPFAAAETKKAVILLAEDKAILFEGEVRNFLNLVKFRFDLERVRSALENPPRTSLEPRLEDFKTIPKGALCRDVGMWLDHWGEPVADPANNSVYAWGLADTSRVVVALTPDKRGKVVYIKHDRGPGQVDDLVK
jgi:hypothetical protein